MENSNTSRIENHHDMPETLLFDQVDLSFRAKLTGSLQTVYPKVLASIKKQYESELSPEQRYNLAAFLHNPANRQAAIEEIRQQVEAFCEEGLMSVDPSLQKPAVVIDNQSAGYETFLGELQKIFPEV